MSRYRSSYSQHTFTQPSLLALLWRMHYEDWTYYETAARLREQAELCAVLLIDRVPDDTKRSCCVRPTRRT